MLRISLVCTNVRKCVKGDGSADTSVGVSAEPSPLTHKELEEALPLHSGENRPWDFVKCEGYDIEVVELTEVDELERHKYADNEWMGREEYRRDAFIIKKPE